MKNAKIEEFLRQNSTRTAESPLPQISVVQAARAVERAEALRDEAAAAALGELCGSRSGDRCLRRGGPCDLKCDLAAAFRDRLRRK